MIKLINLSLILSLFFSLITSNLVAQQNMANVYGRRAQSLNGKWDAIVDLYDQGRKNQIYLNKKAENKTDFYEYAFENGLRLNVPSDWNSQMPELKYYEGTIWYGRKFDVVKENNKRLFLYFAAVSYRCRIYLNGQEIAQHEGGFTPFQIEITDAAKENDNFLAVEVNNSRQVDAIPAMAFDWWNYGGITRDVFLVSTPKVFIDDYFVQLDKTKADKINAKVKLSETMANSSVTIEIPELQLKQTLKTDAQGEVKTSFLSRKIKRWSPTAPKLYNVKISTRDDQIEEEIGFRNIWVKGEDIFLNGEAIFLKSISFHEEIPQRKGRAFSQADAVMLLSEAKALGCNMIRLAHYPQNEYIVRMAEKMGFLLWEEIPIWQGIDFENESTKEKAGKMMREMVARDKNRCALAFWGVANETQPSEPRNAFIRHLIATCRGIDTTRLITAAFDLVRFNKEKETFVMDDPFTKELDVVAVNKYLGWYHSWPVSPDKAVWDVARGQPLIISEFGGEALYGKTGEKDVVSSWSEDYQATLYKNNLEMFKHIPNLRGTSPWLLFDFRSPFRFHPTNQDGWNRKGLISDQGYRKKAWFLMKHYYDNK
ncbi:glycoside hydrolase family 2 protein [Sphingobacterium multivorum]|uniref:glycoside hydrolase family 2 protein n=1 Tax=Sphingobacterium TaxID=28453 RepID=UPI000E012079|nr:glycoside hydrolase family 2 TIM barrel-domain containing protein [Sphingobacterium multivorum]QQT44558.1 glycoside hydrolase family 2 [Sphingobacterium multivorum]SUJ87801.1 Beta-glucuronidase [Sphingobacterium multivorum]